MADRRLCQESPTSTDIARPGPARHALANALVQLLGSRFALASTLASRAGGGVRQ